jgi:hypothetical protein
MPMYSQARADHAQRVDVNLIAMLLWQSLLTGVAVMVSHMGWYLSEASAGEMGLQYGLIAFGFLCISMVLFQVGGVRDHLSMRAEFSKENQFDKWFRNQVTIQNRRLQKQQWYAGMQDDMAAMQQQQQGVFGLPNTPSSNEEENSP